MEICTNGHVLDSGVEVCSRCHSPAQVETPVEPTVEVVPEEVTAPAKRGRKPKVK